MIAPGIIEKLNGILRDVTTKETSSGSFAVIRFSKRGNLFPGYGSLLAVYLPAETARYVKV